MAESTVYTGDKMGGDTTIDMETSATKSTVSGMTHDMIYT